MQPDLTIRKNIGKMYINENRLADALDVFSNILSDYPDDLETLQILGNFYLASGDGKTAKKIYMRALELDPGSRVIIRQIGLAEEISDTGIGGEAIPTELPAITRMLQRLTGKKQKISEEDIMRAANLLEKIITSENPAELVAIHLDEIDELLPALIELNIRQAFADGAPELAESLRALQTNIDHQLDNKEDIPLLESDDKDTEERSYFNSNVLILLPEVGKISSRMTLLRSALEAMGCKVSEKHEYIPGRNPVPDVVITSNPHINPPIIASLSALSNAGVPILLDLDKDFEKQPISHHEYNSHGLGNASRSNAYTTAISMARMVTVSSHVHADSLKNLVQNVRVIPDSWSAQNRHWQKEPLPHSTINLGWLGNSGELEDLVSIRRFMVRIIREFPNTKVVIIGSPQAYRLFESLPENRRMYLPAVNQEEFPFLLSQLDVLLVPLRNTPYNISQPDTPLMQAGAKGIPWVASSIPAFRRWQSGGMLCESLEEWHLTLRHLVVDESLRYRLGMEGRRKAEPREMGQVQNLWADALKQAVHTRGPIPSTLEITAALSRPAEH